MIFRSCKRALRLPCRRLLFRLENVIKTAECPRSAQTAIERNSGSGADGAALHGGLRVAHAEHHQIHLFAELDAQN
jgi:hypothetical protein